MTVPTVADIKAIEKEIKLALSHVEKAHDCEVVVKNSWCSGDDLAFRVEMTFRWGE